MRRGTRTAKQKTFVIASTPPEVKIKLERTRFHRGEVMLVKAGATASTRTLMARLEGAAPVDLRWSRAAEASVGEMRIPETLACGDVHAFGDGRRYGTQCGIAGGAD